MPRDVLGIDISYLQLPTVLGWDPGVKSLCHTERRMDKQPGVCSYKPHIPLPWDSPFWALCAAQEHWGTWLLAPSPAGRDAFSVWLYLALLCGPFTYLLD